MYCCNVEQTEKIKLLQNSGFCEGTLPFKYLGVNVGTKKLSRDDCQCLIDKITARIRCWGCRSLSYAGRTQLVNSVLMSLHIYWASIFVIPKAVLDGVAAICRNYLWEGKVVCKKKGGLGVQNSYNWNIAAIGKQIWNISQKKDSLWLRWVNEMYWKGRTWKRFQCAHNTSWNWKHLWWVKDKLKTGYVGNSWSGNPNGYTIASGYNWLEIQYSNVKWGDWVWNKLNIPRHKFVCWLIMWRRIRVRVHLYKIGVINNPSCPLCDDGEETVDHLFFECDYSRKCSYFLQKKLMIIMDPMNIEDCNNKIRSIKGRFQRQVLFSCYAGLLYVIWIQINKVVWNKCVMQPEKVIQKLWSDLFHRISYVMPVKTSKRNQMWFKDLFSR
ncbi:uncharacterized protein LOC110701538 [Chenopodium quinoa]|uniref:uncharacterized protein LOC110701538 n=1 Tax=Chenopodium quinoa TaxID=63459 RepID=UPI000B779D60|nr:uncharacterized protein LOC110701538 [Chenopodium quinoa]